jgi:hypothetical protein
VERELRDLRGRVKAGRAALAAVPGAADAMRAGPSKEAAFLARFGITQVELQEGAPGGTPSCVDGTEDAFAVPIDEREAVWARGETMLPG